MKNLSALFLISIVFIVGCQPSETAIQTAIVRTQVALPTNNPSSIPATNTPIATSTITPTVTKIATSTAVPQLLLLRKSCGSDYKVRANEPVLIYYGGWATTGLDLAQQWMTSLVVDFNIDTLLTSGELHPPEAALPLNCPKDYQDSYWIYYTSTISGLSEGVHDITVTFNTLKALPDYPGGKYYVPGKIRVDKFKVMAE